MKRSEKEKREREEKEQRQGGQKLKFLSGVGDKRKRMHKSSIFIERIMRALCIYQELLC